MVCVQPPELTDSVLLAYLDGEADEQLEAHLDLCAHCRARAERLTHLQRYLTAGLRQNVCPAPTVLGEYCLGLLPDEWVRALDEHLAECPHCASEVAQLQADLGEMDAEYAFRPLEQIRVWFAEFVRGGRETAGPRVPSLAPAYAGVRGGEAPPRLYRAGKAEIRIEIQDDTKEPERKEMLGFVTGIEPRELRAGLWLDQERVGEVLLDDLGSFLLAGLMPGRYDLILSGPEVEIHIQELDLGTD